MKLWGVQFVWVLSHWRKEGNDNANQVAKIGSQ
jgi:hypothetical protein